MAKKMKNKTPTNAEKTAAIVKAWRETLDPKNSLLIEQVEYFVHQTLDGECTCRLEPPLEGHCLVD
jgi:hypothetical protein